MHALWPTPSDHQCQLCTLLFRPSAHWARLNFELLKWYNIEAWGEEIWTLTMCVLCIADLFWMSRVNRYSENFSLDSNNDELKWFFLLYIATICKQGIFQPSLTNVLHPGPHKAQLRSKKKLDSHGDRNDSPHCPPPKHNFKTQSSLRYSLPFLDCKQLHNMQNMVIELSFPNAPSVEDWRFGHDHDSPYPCSVKHRGIHQEGLIGIQDAAFQLSVDFWSFRRPRLHLWLGYHFLGKECLCSTWHWYSMLFLFSYCAE